jgi:hypothetical protein
MDLNKLTNGDKVIGIGGILFILFFWFPWYGKGGYSRNGTEYIFTGWLPMLLVIACVAVVAVQRFTEADLPELGNFSYGQALLAAGGLAALLVLVRLAIGDDYEIGLGFGDISLDRKFGLFLATLAVIAVAVGGFLRMQEDKAGTSGGAPPAPPPPAV